MRNGRRRVGVYSRRREGGASYLAISQTPDIFWPIISMAVSSKAAVRTSLRSVYHRSYQNRRHEEHIGELGHNIISRSRP